MPIFSWLLCSSLCCSVIVFIFLCFDVLISGKPLCLVLCSFILFLLHIVWYEKRLYFFYLLSFRRVPGRLLRLDLCYFMIPFFSSCSLLKLADALTLHSFEHQPQPSRNHSSLSIFSLLFSTLPCFSLMQFFSCIYLYFLEHKPIYVIHTPCLSLCCPLCTYLLIPLFLIFRSLCGWI